MKLKAIALINTGLYMDLKVEVEIEVPNELKNQELIKYLHQEYWGLLTPAKLEKFDPDAPAKIVEDPVWKRYKKPYDKLFFAGKKENSENSLADAELDTEKELPEVDEGGIS